MRLLRAAVATIVTALAISAASAQTGGLRVRVYDAKDKSPLQGATVTLSHATGNVKTTTEMADENGFVVFPVLRAGGGYTIEVYMGGYQKVSLANQRVKIGETLTLPVGLSEDMTVTVEVIGTKDVVDMDKGTQGGAKFSDEFIQELPVQGRFYQNVLTLAPGVSDSDGDGNPNVNGARQGDFKAEVGGVANVDPLTGNFLNFINSDSIEEIDVVTTGAGVDVGRAQGGYAKILQKQGTNEFEGKFSLIYSTSLLDGNGASDLSGRRVPEFDSYQPAIRLSGPILKDKLWYFLAHEYQKLSNPVNTGTEVTVSTLTRPIVSDTLTWQASPRNKLQFQFQNSPTTVTNLGVSSVRPEESAQRNETGGPEYRMTWTAPYSPKLLIESTVAFQDVHSNILPMTSGVANTCVNGYTYFELSECQNFSTALISGSQALTHRDQRQRFTMTSNADLYGGKIWGANHQFQMGFSVENERYFQYENHGPESNFQYIRDLDQGEYGILNTQVRVPQENTAQTTGTTWAIYAADQIKPLNNLTINIGFRFGREQLSGRGYAAFDPAAESALFVKNTSPPPLGQNLPKPQELATDFTAYEGINEFLNQLATTLGIPEDQVENTTDGFARQTFRWLQTRRIEPIDIVNNNFEPNLSLAWDPWSNGKTKFSVSAARHYGLIPLDRPALELGSGSAFVALELDSNGSTGGTIALDTNGVPAKLGRRGGINPAVDISVVDHNLRTPYQDEYAFKFERELTPEMAFKVTALHRDFKDQHQDVDINHAPGDYGRCVLQATPDGPYLQPGTPTLDNPTGGDGVIDDCSGKLVRAPARTGGGDGEPGGSDNIEFVTRPDGYADTYVLNPGWGSIFYVANINTQKYDAIILQLQRRLYRGWQLDGSYTLSKVTGDAESFNSVLGDDLTNVEDEKGLLSYDQTHVVKINATTVTNSGISIGGSIQWQSGFPFSVTETSNIIDAVPPQYNNTGVPSNPRTRIRYPSHQRNDQRNESYWNFDTRIAKDFSLAGGKTLGLSLEIFNLLNDDSLRILQVNNQRSAFVREFGRQYQLGMSFAF